MVPLWEVNSPYGPACEKNLHMRGFSAPKSPYEPSSSVKNLHMGGGGPLKILHMGPPLGGGGVSPEILHMGGLFQEYVHSDPLCSQHRIMVSLLANLHGIWVLVQICSDIRSQ